MHQVKSLALVAGLQAMEAGTGSPLVHILGPVATIPLLPTAGKLQVTPMYFRNTQFKARLSYNNINIINSQSKWYTFMQQV